MVILGSPKRTTRSVPLSQAFTTDFLELPGGARRGLLQGIFALFTRVDLANAVGLFDPRDDARWFFVSYNKTVAQTIESNLANELVRHLGFMVKVTWNWLRHCEHYL
tara:strand:- start:1423 stop:1743 length:321 start_codon:yes stop_codon:yes gene_type:complete